MEREFRDFLRCGWLAGGFARFRCAGCGHDRLVAFSCKGRGFCPSCGGRQMAERAAHLVDHVFPDVPVRQWVLSLPHGLRYRLAWDHDLCRGMSDMNGYALIQTVRALSTNDSAYLPALALTVYAQPKDRDQAIAAGFDRHLAKPVEPYRIARIVAEMIEQVARQA